MLRPENDSWAAVINDSADPGAQRLGTAVVIDGYRLLPCLHVAGDRDRVRVAFPKAAGPVKRRRWTASIGMADPYLDMALLRLMEIVPPSVSAAPLRCPSPGALVDKDFDTPMITKVVPACLPLAGIHPDPPAP